MTQSPAEALGEYAELVKTVVIKLIQDRTDQMMEAADAAQSRYGMVFGAQWRDLHADAAEAFHDQGYDVVRLRPAGYDVPVINNSLVYLWRKPNGRNKDTCFATSQTRRDALALSPNLQLRLEYDGDEPIEGEVVTATDLNRIIANAPKTMNLVVIRIMSSDRGLDAISWAVVTPVADGTVRFNHEETLWTPALAATTATADNAAFDSGEPIKPALEPREGEGGLDDR